MAAGYSGASYRPLGTQTEPAMDRYDVICLHTMVGSLYGTDQMFHDNGYSGTESHYGVGGIWGSDAGRNLDGVVYQWQDEGHQADANLDGNPRVISIETADNAAATVEAIPPWTPRQCESIARLVADIARRRNIPVVLIPDSKPTRRGIGYHRQGCEHSDGIGSHPGYLVAGGERWSNAIGKGCPGPARIAQITSTIIPRVQQLLSPAPTPEDPMPALPALVKTSSDPTVYLVTDVGKRRVVSPAVRDALVADFDFPPVVTVSATSLSMFPTLPLDGNNNASDPATSALAAVSAVATQVAGVAAQLQQLAVAESDNATATQLAQSSAQLAAAVQALGVVVGDDATQSSVDELQDLVQEVHDAVVPPPAP